MELKLQKISVSDRIIIKNSAYDFAIKIALAIEGSFKSEAKEMMDDLSDIKSWDSVVNEYFYEGLKHLSELQSVLENNSKTQLNSINNEKV